ncbi:MAG: PAS domain S-box protein [Thermoplasmatota archaeon]
MKTIQVLLIENTPADARLVQEMLTDLDDIRFEVTTRDTLEGGTAFLDGHDADVVLLDLELPDSQGIDTFKAVQRRAPLIPVVVLTGLKDEELALEMAREGAQEYLTKGNVNSEILVHTIQYAIERKRVEQRMARLNSLLRAIREVNRLIVQESDPEELATKACTFLANIHGYHQVRMFLTDEVGEAHIGVCVGRDGTEKCTDKRMPACMDRAMADGDMVTVEDREAMCPDCPWTDRYEEAYTAVTVPLSYLGNMYGALSILLPAERHKMEEETGLLWEMANDMAFALYDMELEEKHREAEERYRQLVETTPGLICQLDPDGTTRFVNGYVEELMGYTVEEVVGQNWWDLFYPGSTREQVDELYERFNAGEDVRGVEMEMTDKRGEPHVISWNSFNRWENGSLQRIHGVGMDVTDLQQSEEKYRLLAENAIDVIWQTDLDMQFTYLSASLKEMTGYEPEEWIGTRPTDHAPPEQAEKMREKVEEYLQRWPKQGHARFESQIVGKDGNEIPVEITGKMLVDDREQPVGFQGSARDITQRKQAEEELKESERLHKEAQRVAHIGHWKLDPDMGTPVWSDEIFRIFGLDPEEGEPSFADHEKYLHPDDWPRLNEAMSTASEKGEPFDIEFRIVRPDGDMRWMHALGTATMAEDGTVSEVFGTAQDITRQKEMERQQAFQARMLDNVGQAVIVTTPEGEIIYWNNAAEELYGWKAEEVLEENIVNVTPTNMSREQAQETMEYLRQGKKWAGEFQVQHKDGSTFPVIVTDVPYFDEDGNLEAIIGISFDLTEQKRIQRELEESEAKYRAIVEASHDAIFIYRGDEFLFVNDRVTELSGYSEKELMDLSIWELIHTDDLDIVKDIHHKWVRGEGSPSVYHARVVTKDGNVRYCEFSMTAITYKGTEAAMGAVRDITKQKQAEEERKQALAEMERALELEKQFKADAAHFFLNPIAITKGYMELSMAEMSEEAAEKIRRAEIAIRRVEAVIKNIVTKGEIHE